LTIRTAPVVEGRARPYDDGLDDAGLLTYAYRGTDPGHRENVGLRLAMNRQTPLIYLFGVVKGEYMPVWPVYVQGDNPEALFFKVAVDDRKLASVESAEEATVAAEARRGYVTRQTLQRVHQASFRQRVLRAYQERCAVCRLLRVELLEAAHILPDSHPKGMPVVTNGIAVQAPPCRLRQAHHGHPAGPDRRDPKGRA
jgi:putative restriction endonuclease